MHRQRGFSLIEMVIILAVISIAVGVLVPVALVGRVEKSNTKIEDDLLVLEDAIFRFYRDTGLFPRDNNGSGRLDFLSNRPLSSAGALGAPPQIINNWNGPYLLRDNDDNDLTNNNVTHDSFGNVYVIQFRQFFTNGKGQTFPLEMRVASVGADARFNTTDDVFRAIQIDAFLEQETTKELKLLNHAIEVHLEKAKRDQAQDVAHTTDFASVTALIQHLQIQDRLLPSNTSQVNFTTLFVEDAWGDNYQFNGNGFLESVND